MTHPDTLQIPRAVVEQALKRAYQLGQTYWQQADSDSWTQNKKSEETQVHFNALVTKTCEALQPQAAEPTEGCGEAGCAEGRCGTTECLPSFKAKKAAAEPVSDLRGIDAGPLSEWVDLVRRGYVKKDECLIAVKDIPKWVGQNTPPATQAAPVSLQPVHDSITVDLLNDRVMRQQAALTAALGALKNSVDTVWEEYTEAERKYAAYDSRRAKLDGMKAMAQAHTDAIAQIEALGE